MGCNSSTRTAVQDTSHVNSECNGANTNGTAVEKAEKDLDIECGAEAAAVSCDASVAESQTEFESVTLNTATEPTPAEDQEAGASAAGQSEQTGAEEAQGSCEKL